MQTKEELIELIGLSGESALLGELLKYPPPEGTDYPPTKHIEMCPTRSSINN